MDDVIGGATDSTTQCGGDTITSPATADPWTTWTFTAPAAATTLCDQLSMNIEKQSYKAAEKTFMIQATVTPPVSADEAEAVALLAAFKTAAASMQGGIKDGTATNTNDALALTLTAKATTDGASAMTTFAVAIAAVAALF